ncbi:lamin tail domain-containing protein [Verrucomicrobia bacterium]|jgi:hypothetical protein|nr:lamin tail domain-containing protein [Verrucomicrobiota bacterium]
MRASPFHQNTNRTHVLPLWGTVFAIALFTAVLPLNAQLVISEIMYHPLPLSPDDDSEAGEYIELYNSGSDSIDLSGHHIDRGITYQFPDNAFISARSYIVVAKDREALPDSLAENRIFTGFTGTLSNAGETIRLLNSLDQTVADVRYGTTGDWPAAPDGTGHSLVFLDPQGNPDFGRDWSSSRNRKGSPGGPEASNTGSLDMTRSLIEKGTRGHYFKGTKEPSGGTTEWASPNFVTNADWISGASGFGYSSAASELVPVSTLLPDMRGNYLSLYVRIPFEVAEEERDRLQQLTLTMHYDDSYVVYLNGTRVAAAGVNGTPPAFDQISNAGADYAPDTINLTPHRDVLNTGLNVLSIQGHNIGLNNSSDFVLGPRLDLRLTPAQTASELIKKILINEVQTNHASQPDFIEFFNPTDEVLDIGGMWLSDKSEQLDLYQIPQQTTITPGTFLPIPVSEELTGFAVSSFGDQVFLTTEDLTSVVTAYAFGPQPPDSSIGRFPDGGSNWFRSTNPSPGISNNQDSQPPIVITEIMYNDPMASQNEYIEIRNLSPTSINVSGWRLGGVQFLFDEGIALEPGKPYLIADNAETLTARYSLSSELILGSFAGSLNNRGERISLLDQDDILIDTVQYDDNFPWPITPDGIGSSLERNCFESDFDDPSAWSASPLNRPSPGAQNNIESCENRGASTVRVSEILYHPATKTEDDRATEFIELANVGSAAVSLAGWVIAGDVFYVFDDNATLAPNQPILIARDPSSLIANENLNPNIVFGPYAGELPNGGGEILLVKNDGRLADRIRYNDDFPWPSIADGGQAGKDISLNRICIEEPGDSPSNWTVLSMPTPGVYEINPQACTLPTNLLNTGTEPQLVTRQIRPLVYAEFSGSGPLEAFLEYWIDDPEVDGEATTRVSLNDQGLNGDQTADDQTWSVELPAFPNNSIVRYKIEYREGNQAQSSPSPARDAFPSHAYFVDPQADSNLPNNYHLFISSANWQALHQATDPGRVTRSRANPRWNDEVPAVFIAEGVVHEVSVRHQGSRWNRKNGSTINFDCESHRNGSAQVRSWRIEFPSYRKHNGMDVILLQKQSGWPQHMSFKMFELAGVPAPRTSWANLRINGCDYNSDAFQIERPGRDLVARWFGEVGDLYKSQGFTGDEGPWSWGDARLIRGTRNGSTEQERYEHTYNRKTLGWKNNPFDGIQDEPEGMIEGLHSARARGKDALRSWLAANFDIERTLRYICTINYVGTFDDMFQNHYLYKKAEDGKWCMFPWDMDNTLGGAFGETNANPFRGVDESRHGNVGNRSGWWNRIKDSFLIAYEPEFLEMFHLLNNTGHSPEAMAPVIQESAGIRGLGQGSVDSLVRHITRRHDFLNSFIEPRLASPSLEISQSQRGVTMTWPSHRNGYRLEQATNPGGPWTLFQSSQLSPLNFQPSEPTRFFRLTREP